MNMNPQDVANTVWSYATLGITPQDSLLQALTAAGERCARDMKPQDVANTVWAYATLGITPQASLLQAPTAAGERCACDMNPQNVANTVWSYATLGITPQDSLLQALTAAGERCARDMKPQEVANTMWAYATLGINPQDSLLQALTAAGERCACDMNPQDVANTVWAYATLGITPQDSLLQALTAAGERCARDMKPQDVANILWAYAVLEKQAPPSLCLCLRGKNVSEFNHENLSQIFYAYMAAPSLGWQLDLSPDMLDEAGAAVRQPSSKPKVSQMQLRVHRALVALGHSPTLEASSKDGFFSVDLSFMAADGVTEVAVEVDGPSHFTSSGAKKGATLLRDRLLRLRFPRVVSMPYFEINACTSDSQLQAYCAKMLGPSSL